MCSCWQVPKNQVLDTVDLFRLPRSRMISLKFLAWYFLGKYMESWAPYLLVQFLRELCVTKYVWLHCLKVFFRYHKWYNNNVVLVTHLCPPWKWVCLMPKYEMKMTAIYTCCSHFWLVAGVDFHFRNESGLPVGQTQNLHPGHLCRMQGC